MTLREILTEEDVVESIRENLDTVLEIIPEIKPMINFPQNHPHHHLDVWEHTLLALSFSDNNYETRIALLLHDIGKPHSYQDAEVRHFHGHADVSEQMARTILPRLNLNKEQIERICFLIKTHDTLITDEEIKNDPELSRLRLHIQECDSKAHDPNHQEKRLKYIDETKKKLPYRNESYLRKEIVEESRHHFIYACDSDKRTEFISSLEKEYPVQIDRYSPSAIYLPTIGLPKVEYQKGIDLSRLSTISNEYLTFLITHRIIANSTKILNKDELNKRIQRILEVLNKYSLNKQHNNIQNIDDLQSTLEQSIEFYYNYFMKYTKGEEPPSLDSVALPFLQLELFISDYKRAINHSSYFSILIDNKQSVDIYSVQAINSLVGARINSDISMNIFTEPDTWPTYRDINGQFVEAIHDYGTLELDSSLKDSLKK